MMCGIFEDYINETSLIKCDRIFDRCSDVKNEILEEVN